MKTIPFNGSRCPVDTGIGATKKKPAAVLHHVRAADVLRAKSGRCGFENTSKAIIYMVP